jgi:hypothetical protein
MTATLIHYWSFDCDCHHPDHQLDQCGHIYQTQCPTGIDSDDMITQDSGWQTCNNPNNWADKEAWAPFYPADADATDSDTLEDAIYRCKNCHNHYQPPTNLTQPALSNTCSTN